MIWTIGHYIIEAWCVMFIIFTILVLLGKKYSTELAPTQENADFFDKVEECQRDFDPPDQER